MARACRTCSHPERERIEQALANTRARVAGGVQRVADKWGIPRSSLQRHLEHHMSQELVARLRLGNPDPIDVSIEEVIRAEGEGAILLLRQLKEQHRLAVERWESLGEFEQARRERIELRKVGELLVLYAGMIPGRKTVTNNNTLVLGDSAAMFAMVNRILGSAQTVQEARIQLASEYRALAAPERRPVIEGAPA